MIEFNGKEYPVELDKTPYRKENEDFEIYKERLKMIKYFQKLKLANWKFKSITNLEKILGKKGLTYKKEA